MNEQKRNLFINTLTKAFNHEQYQWFINELLVNIMFVAPDKDLKPYNTFSSAIPSAFT